MAAFHFTAHNWAKSKKNRQKRVQKFREIVESYLCKQRFHKFWMWRAGNRKRKLCKFYRNLQWKNSWKSLWLNFFSAVFCHLEPLCNPSTQAQTFSSHPSALPWNARPQSNFPASFRMKRKTRGKMEASDWLKAQLRHLLPLYYKLLVTELALFSRCMYCHCSLWSRFRYFVQKLSSIFFISNKWNLIQITNES